jgi:hypothetical protein
MSTTNVLWTSSRHIGQIAYSFKLTHHPTMRNCPDGLLTLIMGGLVETVSMGD